MQGSRLVWMALVVSTALTLAAGLGQAQQETGEPAEQPAATKKERAKPRGRLPVYFADVVTAAQREEIYEIQGKYNEQIEQLEAQLVSLRQQRDMEVENVLTPEQKERVAQLRQDAQKRRADRSAKQSPDTSEEAGGT